MMFNYVSLPESNGKPHSAAAVDVMSKIKAVMNWWEIKVWTDTERQTSNQTAKLIVRRRGRALSDSLGEK